jgi:hypothetical protein
VRHGLKSRAPKSLPKLEQKRWTENLSILVSDEIFNRKQRNPPTQKFSAKKPSQYSIENCVLHKLLMKQKKRTSVMVNISLMPTYNKAIRRKDKDRP